MGERNPAEPSRRTLLASVGSLVATQLAGCTTGDGDGTTATIDIPDVAPIDREISPVIEGIESDQVTVTASASPDGVNTSWLARATFDVEDGRVDLGSATPVEGDYEGADPMGLFWAMETDLPQREALFPFATHEVELSVYDGRDPIGEATTTRRLYDAETEPFADDVVGSIHLPDGDDPAPAVLLLHGSGGDPSVGEARAFAGRGFVAGSLQYFGEPEPIPDDLAEIPVEYVGRAIDQLLAHDRVAGENVGIYASSRGTELALLAGVHLDTIGAIAGVSGSGVVVEGVTADRQPAGRSAWSVEGEPVPYVSANAGQDGGIDDETLAEAAIPIERVEVPVLLVSGGDDQLWDSVRYIEIALERLQDRADPPTVDHLVYDRAGHTIVPPYWPTYGSSEIGNLSLGGSVEANAAAAADYWPRVIERFEAELGK